MACDFEVYLVGSCTLISKQNYCHFGRLIGDQHCVVLICINAMQYISVQSVFLSYSVLSSADSRTISSAVCSGQKLIAVIGYLDNSLVLSKVDERTHQSTDKGH